MYIQQKIIIFLLGIKWWKNYSFHIQTTSTSELHGYYFLLNHINLNKKDRHLQWNVKKLEWIFLPSFSLNILLNNLQATYLSSGLYIVMFVPHNSALFHDCYCYQARIAGACGRGGFRMFAKLSRWSKTRPQNWAEKSKTHIYFLLMRVTIFTSGWE